MSALAVKGRCPSLLAPMASGDGLLVRVKPRAATLTAGQAEAVAAGARRYGNGLADLTNRGHLQIRGIAPSDIDGFAEQMAQIRLAAAQPRAESVRNVLADPLGADDPRAAFDSHALAHRLSALLEDDPSLHDLPDKFGLSVDSGVALPLAGCTADIMVRSGDRGLEIALDRGDRLLGLPARDVEDAVRQLIGAFLSWRRARKGPRTRRMRAMVAALGADAVFEAAGLRGARRARRTMPGVRPSAGFTPAAGARRGFFLAGAPFGSLDAAALADLAALSRRFADGKIRVTPWKAVVLWGVARPDAGALREAAGEAGLVAEPEDARQRIVTCAGRPGCASAYADTRADAAFIAATGAVPAGLLHISGCRKGCAHPSPAPVTLVATAGGYNLVRSGRVGDPPERAGLTPAQAARELRR